MKITFEHTADVDTINIGLPGLKEIVIDYTGVPQEQRSGIAKALLAAAALSCHVSTLSGALEARGARVSSCTAEAEVQLGTNSAGQGRVKEIVIQAVPSLATGDEAIFERCEKIMRQGCLVTSSLEEGIAVSHTLSPQYT